MKRKLLVPGYPQLWGKPISEPSDNGFAIKSITAPDYHLQVFDVPGNIHLMYLKMTYSNFSFMRKTVQWYLAYKPEWSKML